MALSPTSSRGGGGSSTTPVSCVLYWHHNVNAVGFYDMNWSALYADLYNLTPLVALPTGLGITTAFDGTDGTLTTTTAGVWSFTFGLSTPTDLTGGWTGALNFNPLSLNASLNAPGLITDAMQGGVFRLPNAASGLLSFQTVTASTTGSFLATVYLSIVRLG